MVYCTCIPQAPLADFIHTYWFYEGTTVSHTKECKLPDGRAELIINLHDDVIPVYDRHNPHHFQTFRGSLLSGAHSQHCVIDTASQASVIGVHFKTGGAFPFFNVPADKLHNLYVSLDTLWGEAASELREQLLAAATPAKKFRILERFLLVHLALPPVHHPAVTFALKELQSVIAYPHSQTVTDVTERTGLSSRQFIQVFKNEVGLTPKLYCRVQRFQKALRLIRREHQVEWMNIALTCGYFDQAHFIHDFRDFSGLNPGAYLLSQGKYRNHVPLSD